MVVITDESGCGVGAGVTYLPEPTGLKSHVGHSLENDTWFVRVYPFDTEEKAKAAQSAFMTPAPQADVRVLEWRRSGWVEAFAKPEGLGLWYSIQPDKPVHGPGDPPFTCFVTWGEPGQNARDYLGEDFPTVDAAKVAAQADFTKRIQSALYPSPQPNTGVIDAAKFLCDRLDDFERELEDDEVGRQYYGHVHPAFSRLFTALAAIKEPTK